MGETDAFSHMRFLSAPVLIFCCLCAASCGPEEETVTPPTREDLLGRWELQRGFRNNMETQTLGELYFEFTPDSVYTNLLGGDQAGTYVYDLEAAEITTENVQLPLVYTVRELSDTLLMLRARVQGYQFDFELVPGGGAD